jgi:hypothetical protein
MTDPSGQSWLTWLVRTIIDIVGFMTGQFELAGLGTVLSAPIDDGTNSQPDPPSLSSVMHPNAPYGAVINEAGGFGGVSAYPGVGSGSPASTSETGALGFQVVTPNVAKKTTPLHCKPDVISAMKKIWAQSSNGTSGAEASFRVDGDPANYNIVFSSFTNQRNFQNLTIIPGTTFALFHVHPNTSGWQPSTPENNSEGNAYGDTGMADKYNLQMYVVSRNGLGFYDPATKLPGIQLRPGLDWTKPCAQPQ